MLTSLLCYWAVESAWLSQTAWLESRCNCAAVGDNGRSRGAYQIQRRTWEHYSRVPWRTGAHDPVESRRVAKLILKDCYRYCVRHKRPVTFTEVRCLWRRGGF